MKLRKITAAIVLVLLVTAALCACSFNFSGNNDSTITVNIYIEQSYGYKASDFVDSAGKLTIPDREPEKEGYDFVCWALDENGETPIVKGKKVSGIVNIYPIFKTAVLDVKIIDEYNGNDVIKVEYGSKAEINPPKADGYSFVGWFKDKECTVPFDTETAIREYTEIYVGWELADYTIEYVLNGGNFVGETPVVSYKITDVITLVAPQKDGYVFDGWYEKSDFTGEATAVLDGDSGNKVFYAKYICNLAEISAKAGFSEKTGENEYSFYTDYTAHAVTITDYFEFSQNSTVVVKDGDEILVGNKAELEANSGTEGIKTHVFTLSVTSESGSQTKEYTIKVNQYDESVITVTYIVDGSTVYNESFPRGNKISSPYGYTGEKTGYDFAYWANGTAEYDFNAPVSENLTLTAVFAAKEYDIIYKLGVAENNPANPDRYTVETIGSLADPTVPEGYTFDGWYLDDGYTDLFSGFTGFTGEKTLYARYTKTAYWNFVKTGSESFVIDGVTYNGDVYEVTKEEYPRLLDYLMFYKTGSAVAVINGLTGSEESGFYTASAKEVEVSCSIKVSYSSNKIKLIFNGYVTEPDQKTVGGTYTQIDFVKYAKSGTRAADFADFAIEHVGATMKVNDTEQLCFALENGYRPVFTPGSTAETVYNAMKDILRGIIGEGFSEKDKALAIAEYLIETVAYDNKALDLFESVEDPSELNSYRCFYLEGAIIDKVAVCDGISKAFGAMCAIEGIKAVQVDGKHGSVNHAWNKVFLDLDGDGVREWSAVDCTSANTLSSTGVGTGVEIINHSFIFTTDDMLINKNAYVYNVKWQDKYVAEKPYDIYKDVQVPEAGVSYYAASEADMKKIIAYYKSLYDALTTGESLIMDFCAPQSLILKGKSTLSDELVNAMRSAGFSTDDINAMKKYIVDGREDGNSVFAFYLVKQ